MAAGQGFKTFNTGDVLSAADVNGYLMQGILVFASATARDAAITSPEEGQFAFLKDTNVTTYYTGSAWANVDTTGMTNPMTTTGDVIYSSSGSTPARLGIGTAGQVLQVNSGASAPEWVTPASGGFVGARVFNSAVQSISASSFTTVTFDSESFDTDAFHSTSVNTGRFTIPAGKGGKYEIYFRSQWNSTDNNGRREFICNKNGSTTLMQVYSAFTTRDNLGFQGTTVQDLSVGDFIDIQVFQGSSGSINLDTTTSFCEFSIIYLGA
jgi:hypothetical protein